MTAGDFTDSKNFTISNSATSVHAGDCSHGVGGGIIPATYQLFIGNTEKGFENISIKAGGYLILADEDAESALSVYGDFYGFSSFALTNAGQVLVLKDANSAIVHSVSYTDEWYRDPVKEGGGWSLEQIDPENPCGGSDNWKAAENVYGGSPGVPNSVLAANPDNTPPTLNRVAVPELNRIQLYFSEPMDSTGLNNPNAYQIDRGIGNPVQCGLFSLF
jgi:hypothetical protein